jgi:hypothetical protein
MARLALVDPSGAEIRWVDFAPCAGWPTAQWEENAVARGRGTLRVDAGVETGTYTVTLALVDPGAGTRAAGPLVLGQVEIPEVARE